MKLQIASGLSLPIEATTEAIGFLGRRGSGKSYAAQKLAEEFHRAKAQFVALDPVGNWYGLRLAANGKDAGIPIPVFGGLQGDVPIEPSAGKIIADTIVDRGISAVVDVSQFESDADKARFARAFCERFYFRKKSSPSAVHLFLEEAQEFIPQNPGREEAQMLHAFTRLAKLGRNFGIGISMLSQRPQEVNKKVLNLTELLFVFQLTGVHERKAVDAWIGDKGIDADIEAELPKLERGKPHVWSPAWLQVSRVVEIAEKWTFDASSTPKVGAVAAVVRELSPIDLEKLRTDMASTIERAKAEDPKELKREIASLKSQLTKAQKGAITPQHPKGVIDQAAIDRAVATALAKHEREVLAVLARRGKVISQVATGLEKSGAHIAQAAVDLRQVLELPAPSTNGHAPVSESSGITKAYSHVSAPAPSRSPRPVPVSTTTARSRNENRAGDSLLPKGERSILTAAAQYPDGATREQLTILTGYKRSTRDAYVQRLGERGFVEALAGGLVVATDSGVDALGSDFEPLPTGAALRAYWLARLPEGERRIFEPLLEAYPNPIDRDALTEKTEYKRSTRDAYLQRLGTRKLVTTDRGGVRAADTLFED